jgi:hypothetical protein
MSANSAKPAIVSISSSRSAMARIVADARPSCEALARLTPRPAAAQHDRDVRDLTETDRH